MPRESDKPSTLHVWRRLLLVGALLVGFGVLAFDTSQQITRLYPGSRTQPLMDGGLTVAWAALAFLLVSRGRAVLVHARDQSPLLERRGWNLVLNLFAALGYLYLLAVALGLLRLNLSGLLVGTAITGVVIGIAAQSALGNLFGGMLVLLLHPYSPGQRITIRSSNFGGTEYTGTVREVTLFYTTLDTAGGALLIPNALSMTAVVRVEGSGDIETVTVPIPYSVPPQALQVRLREAGLHTTVNVEAFSDGGYTVRLVVPAHEAARIVPVMAGLSKAAPGPADP